MSSNDKKLKVKDLVLIGIFTVIYFVVMYGVGMMGMVPILFLIYPTVLGIVTGPILMLFMAKVQKPFSLFILGILSPLLMFIMGHTYILLVHSILIMVIAELIRRAGKYNSFKHNMFSFGVFNAWICGSLMQILFVRERYMEMTTTMMGEEYASGLERLVTYPNMALVYLGAIVGGIIGALLGKLLLRKHFEKAGIV
ncbi:MAG TPA: MptD family putative ECF transporter S component [Clostridia bacterium]|jgi:energy-coupling factor transport system substrate-specific component|nr:MptD family putative ECF transporter S component [Clostridia bacterium]HQC68209.1 MptD family putative ECF transporter S component [Clostridia bacterium]